MRFISYLFSFYLGILTKRYIHLFKAFSLFFNFTILGLKPKRFLYNEKFVFFMREREGGKRALPVIQFFAMVSPVLTNFNLWRTK